MLVAAVRAHGIDELEALLEGLVRMDLVQLRRGMVPPLYQSGVRYRREPRKREDWQTAAETYARRYGDCEDLAAYRAADLRLAGIEARAIVYQAAPGLKHVVVEYPDGRREDPSKRLGMLGRG